MPAERFTVPGWRYDIDATPAGLVEVVRQAVGAIGTIEDPPRSNRGPLIDRWTGMVGKARDVPGPKWCAYGVSAWYAFAEGGSPFGRLGSAYKINRWALEHGRVLPAGAALRPGDIALLLRGDLTGHVELVVAALLEERIATVGGNVAQAVRGRVHLRGEFPRYVRPFL